MGFVHELHHAHGDLAALCAKEAREGLERRALARPVGSQEGDDPSLGDPERDPFEHEDHVVVDDLDVVDRQERPVAHPELTPAADWRVLSPPCARLVRAPSPCIALAPRSRRRRVAPPAAAVTWR
jgi:hypothetical protein